MGYYLNSFQFDGEIPSENVSKLSDSFLNKFYIEKDEDGTVRQLLLDDMKLNFEDEVIKNSHLFKDGSTFFMVGEEGENFRWVIDHNAPVGYREVNGVTLFPLDDVTEALINKIDVCLEFIAGTARSDAFPFITWFDVDGQKYRLSIEEVK